ncbi:MAG: ABC transporter permease [Patescibacteria group bacterium]
MINKNIVIALIYHYSYIWRHSWDRIGDSFYWPAMNIFVWGLMSLYVKNASTEIPHIIPVILTGVVFWLVVWRAQHEISLNLLEEFWNRNLVNIFISPVRLREWITSVTIFSIVKMLLTLSFAAVLVYFLYAYNIFIYGFLLIPFTLSLMLTGWFLGFFVSGIIMRFGPTFQTLAWITPMIIVPFSSFYYPVYTLPDWAQTVAKFLPSTYIMEGMREIIFTDNFTYDKLFISFGLNFVYLALSITFFIFMFNKSKELGFGRWG